MRFGPRRPSLKGRIAARTSWKRFVRHFLGVKAPPGWGWITNPRKAAYNRIYHRTTFDLLRPRTYRAARGGPIGWLVLAVIILAVARWLF